MSKYDAGVANAKKRVIIRRMIFNRVRAGPTTNARSPKMIEFAKMLIAKVRTFSMKAPVLVTHETKFNKTCVMIVIKSENKVNNEVPRFGNPNPLPVQFKKFTT